MKNINELIKERRTIHSYSDEPIDDRLIKEAINCALHAPNHKLTFPIRFTIIPKKFRKDLSDISLMIKRRKGKLLTSEDEKKVIKKFEKPSHILIVSQIKSTNPLTLKEDYATLAMGIQNFSLFLWEKGFGTKWSSGSIIKESGLYKLCGIDPDKESIEALLWAGFPGKEPSPPKRPSVNDVTRILGSTNP